MRKYLLCTIALLIHLNVTLTPIYSENLPDGAEILRPLYQDEKQGFYAARIKPPGKPNDYEGTEYFKLFRFLIYRLDKETGQYAQFVPYDQICDIPQDRRGEFDPKPLQHALFQGPGGPILIELDYAKGKWKALMNLHKELEDTVHRSWDIQYTSNPNLFAYSRAINGELLKYYNLFELGLIDVSLNQVKVFVPQVFRENEATSSRLPTAPFVLYREEYLIYPVTVKPEKTGEDSLFRTYDSLRIRSIASGAEIEVATHKPETECRLYLGGDVIYYFGQTVGKVEDLIKRLPMNLEGSQKK